MPKELTEEDVFLDDKDPLEAIREIRREEGVPEEDLPELDSTSEAALVIEDKEDTQEVDDEEEELEIEQTQGQVSNTAGKSEELAPEKTGKVDDTRQSKEGETETVTAEDDDEDADPGNKKETDPEKGQAPEIKTFRANGQEFQFSHQEMLEQFETVFGKAMNYTQKMQKIAPYRKMISALEEEGITHDKLNIAIDALKGDKGAIKKLLEDNKLDAYDLTSEEENTQPYSPKQYGKDETVLEIEEITSRIQGDTEFKITQNVIDEQWDDGSRSMITRNPNMIIGLHNDIKTGLYDKVAPVAMKMKVLDGNTKSDIEYYMLAGQKLASEVKTTKSDQKTAEELNAPAQAAESKFEEASSVAQRKRSATSTGARADRKGVIDYLDDDDEAYEEWYKNLQASI